MNTRAKFPLGLPGFAIIVALFKSASLSLDMTDTLGGMPGVLSLDVAFLGALCFLAVLHFKTVRPSGKLTLKILLILFTGFYTIHSFVLLALDEYMNLFDLGRYFLEWQVVLSFFDTLIFVVILAFLLAVFINIRSRPGAVNKAGAIALLAMVTGPFFILNAPFPIQKYAVFQPNSLVNQFTAQRGNASYSDEDLEFYTSAGPGPVEFIDGDPNIILLIVESLSSINSKRTSGQGNLLGQFDQLSEQGVLFRNFFANHSASEGGIISFLSGFPPLHYPGATPLMFDEFAIQSSVLSEYRQRGYFTEFLTNTDLGFIGMDRYISGLQFDLARGRDEIPEFREAPKIVQNAPSDRFLYREAIERVNSLNAQFQNIDRPWLLTLATVSTHLPYTHPEGGEDSAEAVWAWSLERLWEFYDNLAELGFFESGVLLVSGDHRQMRPLTRQETARYGDSAKARIPLLVIGRDYPAGLIDDRFFQQADLLRMLGRMADPDAGLTSQAIWVERYNRIYGKVDSINRFGVFDGLNQGQVEFPVRIVGTELSWFGEKPGSFRKIEANVHAQRSRHQFVRSGGMKGCSESFPAWEESPSDNFGMLLEVSGVENEDSQCHIVQNPGATLFETGSAGSNFRYRTYLVIDQPGRYWFRMGAQSRSCLGIDQQLIVDQLNAGAGSQGSIELDTGLHSLDLTYYIPEGISQSDVPVFSLQWVPPDLDRWRWSEIPEERFIVPVSASDKAGSD